MGLFLIGNTPKQWLHDMFAKHTGCGTGYSEDGSNTVATVKKVQCNCSDIVIESPFTSSGEMMLHFRHTPDSRITVPYTSTAGFSFPDVNTLRGPPVWA